MKADTESFWEVAVYELGYETRGRSVVALQIKNNVSNFKTLCTMNRHKSVTVRYRGERVKSSESGIWENPIVHA